MTPVRRAGAGEDWGALLALIRAAFAAMEGRVDPPSSVHRLTEAEIARAGIVLVAGEAEAPLGCVLCGARGDALYLSKLAVRPDRQGTGVGRALVAAAEAEARALGLAALALETRIELPENHAAFRRMGFVETGRSAHPGFDRPTSLRFRKALP